MINIRIFVFLLRSISTRTLEHCCHGEGKHQQRCNASWTERVDDINQYQYAFLSGILEGVHVECESLIAQHD